MKVHALAIVSVLVIAACSGDTSGDVDCTRAYVVVEDATKKEFQRYVPAAQDWAYLRTDYSFTTGEAERVYTVNHNSFLTRRKEDFKHLVVSEIDYNKTCGLAVSDNNMLFLMVDAGDKYTEYRVEGIEMYRHEGEKVSRVESDDLSELLVDYNMLEGEMYGPDSMDRRFVVRKVSEFDCHVIQQITRFHGNDSINEVYIKALGSTQNRTPVRDLRLYLINDLPIGEFLSAACD